VDIRIQELVGAEPRVDVAHDVGGCAAGDEIEDGLFNEVIPREEMTARRFAPERHDAVAVVDFDRRESGSVRRNHERHGASRLAVRREHARKRDVGEKI
jgi:hypothetical protein